MSGNGEFEDNTRCPVCRSHLIGDVDRGELICPRCGYVSMDNAEDHGPEWKALDSEDKLKRVRVGSPLTLTLHDYGLSTEIGNSFRDSHGRALDPYMRSSIGTMRKWQTRIRTTTSSERVVSHALSKINEISSNMNLPKNVTETAAHIYRNAVKMNVTKSKSILGITTASVYLACRKCSISRTLKEVARAAGIDGRTLAKYYRFVLKEVESQYVPPPTVQKYISKLINVAKIDTKVERLA
ncbi:MAG: transcription initiation factor IIB, partial [Thaumarchaeota archaeon]|nr:transcription initiation factor IIB [Nitrososphaerota archaeon]